MELMYVFVQKIRIKESLLTHFPGRFIERSVNKLEIHIKKIMKEIEKNIFKKPFISI